MAERSTTPVVLTDIEGTTSSISFVHDVLFPYAACELPSFLAAHADQPDVVEQLVAVRDQIGEPDADIPRVTEVLGEWIAADRKLTPLKALQGMIWRAGFEQGIYQAHVYADAHSFLRAWHHQGIPLYVYSSGSIQAQRLYFRHTEFGDLSDWFAGHFDTTTGPKRAAQSYQMIADQIGGLPSRIHFLSDVTAELDAAAAAGMQTWWVVRHPDIDVSNPAHTVVTEFGSIVLN